ncbi:TnsD family Tn7-like transposition protein [Oceanospirillum sp. HFRX-1_2]
MLIQNFPRPIPDELLGSILARFVRRMGIRDDKVALELLFGSRNVVPSALMQGHVDALLLQVGHLWDIAPDRVLDQHTLLLLFRPFSPQDKYDRLIADLRTGQVNFGMLRSGINASSLNWPNTFRVCPVCWQEQKLAYGFTVWSRLFQCPGVECCPRHRCLLQVTGVPLYSERRHQFVGTHVCHDIPGVSEIASEKQISLSISIRDLLQLNLPYIPPQQWSAYYQHLSMRYGLLKGRRIDHAAIRSHVLSYWGEQGLQGWGLYPLGENNWLISIFRKHRRPFNYLQHLIVLQAFEDVLNVENTFKSVAAMACKAQVSKVYSNSLADGRRDEYRNIWLQLRKQKLSLKELREQREGARVYSWLYRFDREWLQRNKPDAIKKKASKRVSWQSRDRMFARRLFRLHRELQDDLDTPRRSLAWYARRIGGGSTILDNLDQLPLCWLLLNRYSESIDEYQARRLARVVLRFIEEKKEFKVYEVERLTGLSSKRIRKAARAILRDEVPCWTGFAQISNRFRA